MILGIDPGLGGALAFYHPELDLLEIHDMPTHTITVNRAEKRRLDLHNLSDRVEKYSDVLKFALVEEVSASPQMGVTSAFTFGGTYLATLALLVAHKVPIHLVRPNTWKRALGLNADKDRSRQLASQLLPKYAHLWPRKGHDGRAEAALLAYYGSKTQ